MSKAFPFVPLDERRSQTKPRITGLTLVKDYQTGLEALEDTLAVVADYVDIFKFVTGTTRLLNRDFVKAKTALLRKYQVQSYLGGQFQEYVLHTMGLDAFPSTSRKQKSSASKLSKCPTMWFRYRTGCGKSWSTKSVTLA